MVVGQGRAKRYFDVVAKGMQPNQVRQSNQRAILTLVANQQGLSNADIARRTGLAPQTVSAVLDDLERAGMVSRGKARRRGGRGQPATPVLLNPEGAYALGAEIGWSHVEVALTDVGGRLISRSRRDYDYPDAGQIFAELSRMLEEVVAPLSREARDRIVGLGLAAPDGLGDPAALLTPPVGQSEIWHGLDLAAVAARATGYDVQLVNDGNAACWAEYAAHTSPRPDSFVYLLIDTFVAGGIMSENRLWEGVTGSSANLGSMLITDRQGKRRFVHEVASLNALRQHWREAGRAPAALDALRVSDTVVMGWIEDAGLALAQSILNAATVLEFDFAIIDSSLPQPVVSRLIEETSRQMFEVPSLGRARPAVRPGHLGRSGAAQGAAMLRMYRRHYSRELVHMSDD